MSLIIHNSPPPPDLEAFNNEDSEVEFDKLFPSCPDLKERILNLCLSHLKNDSDIKNLSLTDKNWNKLAKNYLKQIKKELEETKPEEDYFYVYRDGDFYIVSPDIADSDNPLSHDQLPALTKLTLNDSSLTTDNGTPKEDFTPIDNSDFKVSLTINNSSPKDLENFKPEDSEMDLFGNQDIFNLCLSFPKNSYNIKTIRQVSKYWKKFVENDLSQLKNKYAEKIFKEIFSQDHFLIKLQSDLIEQVTKPEMSPTLFKEICAATRQDHVVLKRIHKELIQILYNSVYGWKQPALGQATVPSEKELVTITTLDLSDCKLTSLPDLVFECKNLTQLNLVANLLPSLQKVQQLTKLTTLLLSNNKFKDLPKEICLLPNLKILHLNINEVHSLPDELWKLTKLENLDLSQNRLRSISEKISSLINLKNLNINDNCIYQLPPVMKDMNINIAGCRFPKEKMFPEDKKQQPESCAIQ